MDRRVIEPTWRWVKAAPVPSAVGPAREVQAHPFPEDALQWNGAAGARLCEPQRLRRFCGAGQGACGRSPLTRVLRVMDPHSGR